MVALIILAIDRDVKLIRIFLFYCFDFLIDLVIYNILLDFVIILIYLINTNHNNNKIIYHYTDLNFQFD